MADTGLIATGFDTAVDEYLTRAYDGDRRRFLLENGVWDPGFAAELGDLGWYALAVPEGAGGLGLPLSELGRVFVRLGRHLVVGASLENLLLPALLQRFTATGANPAVSAAVQTGVPLALVDPGVTDNWAADLGSITVSDQRLSGSVAAVRFARHASLLVVVADTGSGSAVYLVDPVAAGVRIEVLDSDDPAIEFARVILDDVHGEAVVSRDVSDGEFVSLIRSWARLLIACELSGIAQHSLERTVDYVTAREQFGKPVGSFQAVKHIAADMHAKSSGLHNLCLAALDVADESSVEDLEVLAATAKAHASDAAVRVCEDAIQLHGGMGFTTENDVSWYYRRALALRGWYGDATELEIQVGAAVLEVASTDAADGVSSDIVASETRSRR